MKVILKESIRGLGKVGDVVNVSNSGYARNYLCPQGKAVVVNAENLAMVEDMIAAVEAKEKQEREAAESVKKKIEKVAKLKLTVPVKEDGELYGAIGITEIQGLLGDSGFEIERKDIHLINGPAKSLGEHPIKIDLYHDLQADIVIEILSDSEINKDD